MTPDKLLLDACSFLWHDLLPVTCPITCHCHDQKTWYLLWL